MKDYDGLRQFCTVRQLEYIDAIEKHGSVRKAAASLGISHRNVFGALASIRRKAAMQGHSPAHDMTRTVPEPYVVRGVSTYYNAEGKPAGQWVKSRLDDDAAKRIAEAAIHALSEDVRGMSPLIQRPASDDSDLLAVYPLGDPHFGLYVWGKEAGEDFDLKEARRVTFGAVDRLVQTAPPANTAIILPLGDIFHADDQSNQTPTHKHQLDVDSRYVQVLHIGIETFRHCVLRALEKHQNVIIRFVQGNHDPHAVWALAFTVAAYFDGNPRVTVDLSPAKHWFFRWGKVLIGATHGDTTKHDALLGVMAANRPEDWGATTHRYWYTGHVHHQSVREYPGVTCESFRTLAAADAYSAGRGYKAGRDMRLIVLHKEHGEIERHRCDIGMI